MAGIVHAFVSGKTDGADATQVQPSNWNAAHTVDQYLDMPVVSATPANPASGIRLHSMSNGGRNLLDLVGPSGVDITLQPALFGSSVSMWLPGTGTTVAINFGVNWTALNNNGGAQATPALASTSFITQMKRATFSSGTASATGSIGIVTGSTVCWRGNAAGLGGFYFFARFGVETFVSTMRVFCGLSANNTFLSGEPSALANTVGMGKDSGDANWQLIFRDATTLTKVNLGVAVAAGNVYDLHMFCAPNDSNIGIKVINAGTNTVVLDNTDYSTNIPANTAFLYARADVQSTAGTTAEVIALNRIYVETDA